MRSIREHEETFLLFCKPIFIICTPFYIPKTLPLAHLVKLGLLHNYWKDVYTLACAFMHHLYKASNINSLKVMSSVDLNNV